MEKVEKSYLNKAVSLLKRLCKTYSLFNSFSKKRIDFIVCGVQKGGTTALDSYLRMHDDICLAENKEVHYFNRKLKTSFDYKYNYYHSYFPSCRESSVIGEITPIYLWWEGSLNEIVKYNSDIKLIVILRNPIERAYSHWNMEKQRGNELRSFSESIRSSVSVEQQCPITSYVDRGFYAKQIKFLLSLFPSKQLLALKQEDLLSNPELVLNSVTDYLSVKRFEAIVPVIAHKRTYDKVIDSDDIEYLIEIYRKDIAELEDLLGWDLKSWKSGVS